MVAHITSVAFEGISVTPVDVQVSLSNGMPAFTIVGLGDKAVAESRERVRSAISAMGLSLPPKRITINLAPANLIKEGSHFDLAIALGLLVAMNVVPEDAVEDTTVLGELALDGAITAVPGVLPAAIEANAHGQSLICPAENGAEARWAGPDLSILAPASLLALVNHIKGVQLLSEPQLAPKQEAIKHPDMADIRGQQAAKRALEIAAAGGHNLLMVGPPGAGKSMLAQRLAGILPELSHEEMLEVSIIQSIAGELKHGMLSQQRPYREPHHNASMPAMVGGGSRAKPGEITLAHRGILFLDELPEFPPKVLDSLRQPLETREVTVSRVQSHVTYPADFQLIAAMNPCRCGYLDDPGRACNKAPKCAVDYQSKLSGPLLDRFDIHIEVPAVKPFEAFDSGSQESSATVAKRIAAARAVQAERYQNESYSTNSGISGEMLAQSDALTEEALTLLKQGVEQMQLSMRGYHRVLKVARTIADLAGSAKLEKPHIAEALSYRQRTHQVHSARPQFA